MPFGPLALATEWSLADHGTWHQGYIAAYGAMCARRREMRVNLPV